MAEIKNDSDKKAKARLDEVLKELPSYCVTFINAKYSSKSVRTLLGYATDLKTFLTYITKHNPNYEGTPIKNIRFEDISNESL